jgi:hypothetical protein
MSIADNDAVARGLWGEEAYRLIPKSVFAAIAWHLANFASDSCDVPGMAEKRFLEEWDALLSHGLSKPSKALIRNLTDSHD